MRKNIDIPDEILQDLKILEALHSTKCEPFGFVNNKYAEAYNNELWVKTYANKKQCLNKIEKLKTTGIDCYMSASFPFTIILNEI